MVASFHLPLTNVMTERPCELLHMDLVCPAHVQFVSGKCYALVVVDNYSRYAGVFLFEKGETFDFEGPVGQRSQVRATWWHE
jgi:hypothetical protein